MRPSLAATLSLSAVLVISVGVMVLFAGGNTRSLLPMSDGQRPASRAVGQNPDSVGVQRITVYPRKASDASGRILEPQPAGPNVIESSSGMKAPAGGTAPCQRGNPSAGIVMFQASRFPALTPRKVLIRALRTNKFDNTLVAEFYQEIDKELRPVKAQIKENALEFGRVLRQWAMALHRNNLASPRRTSDAGPYEVYKISTSRADYEYYIYYSDVPKLVELRKRSEAIAVKFEKFVVSRLPTWRQFMHERRKK